jgi:hypothetical protein
VLKIELLRKIPRLAFRITDERGEPARLLTVWVQETDGNGPLWGVAPHGIIAKVEHMSGPVEIHEPSSPEAHAIRSSKSSLELKVVQTSEVVEYGVAPPGFYQAVPPLGDAPALAPSRKYVVVAAGAADMGYLEFNL